MTGSFSFTTDQPVALDAFCGVGGITQGLIDAGFYVVGVDIMKQPDYCGHEFWQSDAIDFIEKWGHEFDVILSSPPCQHDAMLTAGTNAGKFQYPDLLEPTRKVLRGSGRPYVIEQPPGKATKKMKVDLKLCGEMFGLNVMRHRNFEIEGVRVAQLRHIAHRGRVAGMRHGIWHEGPYFAVYGEGGGKGSVEEWREAMGIDWTWNRKSIAEAIPPAYSEYIGGQIYAQLTV